MRRKEKLKSFFTVPVMASMAVLAGVLVLAIFAGVISPHDPNALDVSKILQNPSSEFLLGTDKSGRDLFSRLIFGARSTMFSAICVVALSAVIGIPVGMAAGYFRGFADKVIMRVCDIVLSFPSLLLAFVLVAAFGRGIENVIIALGILYVPMLAKLTRSLVLVESGKVYVEAAHSIGFSDGHIMLREIFPNIVSTVVIQLMLDVGYAILDLSAMSFLGLGVQPPTADWGAMLEEGRILITSSPVVAHAHGYVIV
ncbi:MAG: ABC transporter permease [Clostridiales Family XIII bacterium]|nr:ABC transporter permease [Clostridiales Family XIII bacterium]